MSNDFLSNRVLEEMNFRTLGDNVRISAKAFIPNPENILIGSNVRIDAYCFISGANSEKKTQIGSFVHLADSVRIVGGGNCLIGDFVNISSGSEILTCTDTFDGSYLVGPTVPLELRKLVVEDVVLEPFSLVGARSLIMPGVTLREGAALGAMSLATTDIETWSIYAGIPAIFRCARSMKSKELAQKLIGKHSHEDLGRS